MALLSHSKYVAQYRIYDAVSATSCADPGSADTFGK